MGHDDQAMGHNDPRVEQLLRQSRPTPDARFVEGLGERLFHRRRFLPQLRFRGPFLAGGAAAAGLAAVLATVSLVGAGPLSSEGDDAARARDDCRLVTVKKAVREPYMARARGGELEIRFRKRVVPRRVKRCR